MPHFLELELRHVELVLLLAQHASVLLALCAQRGQTFDTPTVLALARLLLRLRGLDPQLQLLQLARLGPRLQLRAQQVGARRAVAVLVRGQRRRHQQPLVGLGATPNCTCPTVAVRASDERAAHRRRRSLWRHVVLHRSPAFGG